CGGAGAGPGRHRRPAVLRGDPDPGRSAERPDRGADRWSCRAAHRRADPRQGEDRPVSGYADLIKLALALLLCAGVALWGRSCGKDAGLAQGQKERTSLEASLAQSNRDLSACTASVGLANNIADQAAAEAIRQQELAEHAAARAAQ